MVRPALSGDPAGQLPHCHPSPVLSGLAGAHAVLSGSAGAHVASPVLSGLAGAHAVLSGLAGAHAALSGLAGVRVVLPVLSGPAGAHVALPVCPVCRCDAGGRPRRPVRVRRPAHTPEEWVFAAWAASAA
ncbi:hypothetical protein GCM10010112_06000 [Actinoplanes lobatus]|nr:hypothetical protein GCM10010112_06000 [Actinoplanes lobatus]